MNGYLSQLRYEDAARCLGVDSGWCHLIRIDTTGDVQMTWEVEDLSFVFEVPV